MAYERKPTFSVGLPGRNARRIVRSSYVKKWTDAERAVVFRLNGQSRKGQPRRIRPIVAAVQIRLAQAASCRARSLRQSQTIQLGAQWACERDQVMLEAYRAGVIPDWVWDLREVSRHPPR